MISGLAMAAAMVGALVLLYRRDQDLGARRRARAFENCRGVLDAAELVREPGDYPALRGRRDGNAVELRLLSENVNVRKLPVLWMLVTVRRRLPVGCAFDLLLRPQNTEFYSGFDRLEHRLPTPEGWPEQGCIRCSERGAGHRLIERLAPHVAAFEGDGRLKELFVAPGGVRLVYLVDEAARSRYLTLRQAVYEHDILDRKLVETVLERAVAIGADLAEEAHEQREPGAAAVPSLHGARGGEPAHGRRAGAERPTVARADDGLLGTGAGLG